jgi:hypothetical protein
LGLLDSFAPIGKGFLVLATGVTKGDSPTCPLMALENPLLRKYNCRVVSGKRSNKARANSGVGASLL